MLMRPLPYANYLKSYPIDVDSCMRFGLRRRDPTQHCPRLCQNFEQLLLYKGIRAGRRKIHHILGLQSISIICVPLQVR